MSNWCSINSIVCEYATNNCTCSLAACNNIGLVGNTYNYSREKEMSKKLNPCPCCGGKAVKRNNNGLYIECCDCHLRTPPFMRKYENDAIDIWNKRPNPWHTGIPTEDGDYFVAYHWGLDNKIMHDMASRILYGATTFENGNWKIDYPYVVVAWQKIEPYEEEK